VSFVGWDFKSLASEDMAQVTATCGASDFDTGHSMVPVFMSSNSTGDSIEECRPTASGIELSGAFVERCATGGTRIDTIFLELVVLSGAGHFGPLLADDSELLGCQDGAPFRLGLGLGSGGDSVRHVASEIKCW